MTQEDKKIPGGVGGGEGPGAVPRGASVRKYPRSLREISDMTGLSTYHISKILNGRRAFGENERLVAAALDFDSIESFRRVYPVRDKAI